MTHDAVFKVYQDRSGILWVGTQDGLLKFDGHDFHPLRHELADSTSLSDDHVMALFDDGEDGLWVGTWTGWLNRVDLRTGEIRRVAPPDVASSTAGAETTSGGKVIDEIIPLNQGWLGLATDVGAVAYHPGEGRYRMLDPEYGSGRDGRGATAIAVGEDGAMWIGYFDGALRRVAPIEGGRRATLAMELGGSISAIEPGSGGRVWVGVRGAGVAVVDVSSGTVAQRIRAGPADGRSLPGDGVQDIWIDEAGEVWIATLAGLAVVGNSGAVHRFSESDTDPWSLPADLVLSLHEDRQGLLWVGTFSGLGRIDTNDRAFTRFQRRTSGRDGVSGSGILSIAPAGGGQLWLGTMGGGLDRLDLMTGDVERWPPDPSGGAGPPHGDVSSLAWAGDGSLLLGTVGGGVSRYDPATGRFATLDIDGAKPSQAVDVLAVFVDHRGEVWASTENDGLHRYDEAAEAFRRFRLPGGDGPLSGDHAWSIIEDRHGRLWVGFTDTGLARISADRSAARLYTTDNSQMHSDRILTLLEGPAGDIWFGTEGAGLGRLDPTTEQFSSITMADGLPHNHVEGLLLDGSDRIWISTNDGLAMRDHDGSIVRFSPGSGLHGRRFYANAMGRTSEGRLVFGGEGGVTIVDPTRIRVRPSNSGAILTGFSVNGEDRPMPRTGERVELGPTENFFALRFTSTDYRDPERVTYRYRLDPLDDQWREVDGARVANYTTVPPDEYTFRLSVLNSEGVLREDALNIDLVVLPPFYETWWFRAGVLVLIASMLAGLYAYRMRQVLRLHSLRFEIAGQLHDEIGSNLASIALKSDALRRVTDPGSDLPAKRRAPEIATALSRLARDTAHALQETVWVVDTRYDTVSGLLTKLGDAADMLLDGAVEYTYSSSPDPPDQPVDMELRQHVYLFYKEALQNAMKHSGARRIDVSVSYSRPRLTVVVVDDGVGFDPGDVVEGHGLGNMRRRANALGALLAIESVPEKGTRVELTVSVG